MVRRCVLAMSAVMVATGACAPDPAFLSERAIEDAKMIGSPPVPVKAKAVSYDQNTPTPAPQVVLPSWKIAAAAKPATASGPPLSPTNLFERVSPSIYGVKVTQDSGQRSRPPVAELNNPQWLSRLTLPIGIDDQGNFFPLFEAPGSLTSNEVAAAARALAHMAQVYESCGEYSHARPLLQQAMEMQTKALAGKD